MENQTQSNNYPNQPSPTQPSPAPTNQDSFQAILPTKNAPALTSYYLSFVSLLPFLGLPVALAAVIVGFVGLSQYRKNPTPGAKAHAIVGIVLGSIALLIHLALGIWTISIIFVQASY